MTLVDSEGFGSSTNFSDYIAYSGWAQFKVGSSGPTISAGGALGDNYMVAGGSCAARRMFPTTYGTFFFGCRIACDATSSCYIYFDDSAGNELFHVVIGSTGTLSVFRGATQLGSTTPAGTVPVGSPSTLTWCYLEVGAVISASAGAVTVHVNGATVTTITAVNNTNSGLTAMQFVTFGDVSGNTRMPDGVAHIYLCDNTGSAPQNTYLGDVRVQTLLPTSNDSVQFTANGLATNWQNAAKVPPVPGTDYNSDANVNDQDTFNCGPMASGLTTVYGVHVKTIAQKSDAGARSLATVMKSGATTTAGTSTALSTSSAQIKTIYQTDPNTSAQWTSTAVNVAKPGYKVSA